MRVLQGHESPETAFVVDDYPYGFRLRCKIRYWVETDPRKGQRFCSQTTNPKLPFEKWNKPKKGNYYPIVVMYADDEGKVTYRPLGMWIKEEEIDKLVEKFGEQAFEDAYRKNTLRYLRAVSRAQERVHVEIVPGQRGQTLQEQAAVMNSAIRGVLKEMAAEEMAYAEAEREAEEEAAREDAEYRQLELRAEVRRDAKYDR